MRFVCILMPFRVHHQGFIAMCFIFYFLYHTLFLNTSLYSNYMLNKASSNTHTHTFFQAKSEFMINLLFFKMYKKHNSDILNISLFTVNFFFWIFPLPTLKTFQHMQHSYVTHSMCYMVIFLFKTWYIIDIVSATLNEEFSCSHFF